MNILLIEDDNDDIELLQTALTENSVNFHLHIIKDGEQVSRYLDICTDIPDIIVMDFNLPKVHGREILKDIKSRNAFQHIPLVILTTSSAQDDIDYSYKRGASKYLIKPTTVPGIKNVVETITGLLK